ncbi:MAG: molybdopterin adenylyltransferase [Candidatus Hydrogenedentes bacterium]|nr:molybdopterin adenylyltransferase [Candidatus Hydrogenedentota bacterium]
MIEVVSVNISEDKGTVKRPVAEIVIDSRGVAGDAHAGAWHRQVSVLSQELIDAFAAETGRPTGPGEFAENITTRGLDLSQVAPLDRFRIGEVELEVTQIGKECHGDACAIYREIGRCVMPKEGLFCRVQHGGAVRPGDTVEYRPRPFRVHVITLSDRAAVGEYEDCSGPAVTECVRGFFDGKRWHLELTAAVLPDDADRLRESIQEALRGGADVILTTGSTGVGPRDIAPETVQALCDKTIPGIMEHIRLKFGADKPNALLSRGIAGIIGTTQLYTLPGSPRSVREYMGEILKTLEHLVYMLHAIDRH